MPIANKTSGIYIITNIINGKVYIGQSKSVTTRWSQHKTDLKRNVHRNNHLQNAFNAYELKNFTYAILEKCSQEIIDDREVYWIDHYQSTNRDYGYNLDSGGRLNKNHSEETRKKIREALIGNKNNKDRVFTEEHKANLSKAAIGRKHSPEHIENNRKAQIGKITSEETKQKLSIANKGKKKPPRSEEHISNLGKSLKGRESWNKGKVLYTQEMIDNRFLSFKEWNNIYSFGRSTYCRIRKEYTI